MNDINKMICEDFPHVNGILIMQNNKVLLRENYNGFLNEDLHKVGCIFKSFISALVGIAIEENLIASLDQNFTDFFLDELPGEVDDKFFHLKLQHILTNTSGIQWPAPNEKLPDDIQALFKLPIINEPGTIFEYKPDPHIMMLLIENLTNKDFIDYANEKLMEPLGINQYIWEKCYIEDLKISMDDLIKLGILYLNKGKWKEDTLFSKNYYWESIRPQVTGGFPEKTDYGYYWWVDKYKNVDFYYASGFGGQLLCVIPELNVTAVIVSRMDRPHLENKFIIRNIIELLY